MDATDRKILEILQENGRITMKKLGELVSMSTPSVIERVRRMEENGVILGYSAIVSPEAVGRELTAHIIVTFFPGKKQGFLEFLKGQDEIIEAQETAGKTDVILRICCADIKRFLSLADQIRQYGTTESYVHMDHFKKIPLLPEKIG